jgi:hypothetical protein
MIRRGYLMLLTGLMAGLLLAGVLSRAYGSMGGASSIGRPERVDLVFLLTSEKRGGSTRLSRSSSSTSTASTACGSTWSST